MQVQLRSSKAQPDLKGNRVWKRLTPEIADLRRRDSISARNTPAAPEGVIQLEKNRARYGFDRKNEANKFVEGTKTRFRSEHGVFRDLRSGEQEP